ncbi:MAG: DUF2207 domain-containing protein [Thermomicrobiales bacterium]
MVDERALLSIPCKDLRCQGIKIRCDRHAVSRALADDGGSTRSLNRSLSSHLSAIADTPLDRPAPTPSWRVLIALVVLVIVLVLPTTTIAEQGRRAVWDRVDVTVSLRTDSVLRVIELDRVIFNGGPFQEGFREIPLTRIERIDGVHVGEQRNGIVQQLRFVPPGNFSRLTPDTYTYQVVGPNVRIRWSFVPSTNAIRTFQLIYDAHGALRVYDDVPEPYQQIAWIAVGEELTRNSPVNAATLTFILPRAVDVARTAASGPGGTRPRDHTKDGRTWTWEASALRNGASFGASLAFPPLVAARKPSWQDSSDRTEIHVQGMQLFSLGLALLLAVAGGISILAIWWSQGRDPEVGPLGDYITQPPEALPPALAGALIDEQMDKRDVTATIIDLARRGVLRIDQTQIGGWLSRDDFAFTLLTPDAQLWAFERILVNGLFGQEAKTGMSVSLLAVSGGREELRARFERASNAVERQVFDDLVQRGYFAKRPTLSRTFWRLAGLGILAAGALVTIGSMLLDSAWFPWLPGTVMIGLGLVLLLVAQYMPRKTPQGATAAAKWMAFERYLRSIARYENAANAHEIFDRYLPYAIAFGIADQWVATFAQRNTPTPRWFGTSRALRSGAKWWPGESDSLPIGNVNVGLQEISTQSAGLLQASSNSMMSLFNTGGELFGAGLKSGGYGARSGGGSSGIGIMLRIGFGVMRAGSGGGGGGFS